MITLVTPIKGKPFVDLLAQTIPTTLAAMQSANLGDQIEWIVVTYGPAPGMVVPDGVRVVECDVDDLCAARNAGLEAAREGIVVSLDADCILHEDAIPFAVGYFERQGTRSIIGGGTRRGTHGRLAVLRKEMIEILGGWPLGYAYGTGMEVEHVISTALANHFDIASWPSRTLRNSFIEHTQPSRPSKDEHTRDRDRLAAVRRSHGQRTRHRVVRPPRPS